MQTYHIHNTVFERGILVGEVPIRAPSRFSPRAYIAYKQALEERKHNLSVKGIKGKMSRKAFLLFVYKRYVGGLTHLSVKFLGYKGSKNSDKAVLDHVAITRLSKILNIMS